MIAALGTPWVVLWWLGLAAFFLVVVPVVILVANRVVRAAREISASADDVLTYGIGVAGNLDPVPELGRTRDLVREASAGLARYEAAVGRLLGGSES